METMARLIQILGMWDEGLLNWISLFGMLDDLLFSSGDFSIIDRLPPDVRHKYVSRLRNFYETAGLNEADVLHAWLKKMDGGHED